METNFILLNNSDIFISVIYHLVKRSGLFHMEIKDRFDLMNIAFDQEDFRVDKNLDVIKKP